MEKPKINVKNPYTLSKLIVDAALKRGIRFKSFLTRMLLYQLSKGKKSYTFFQSLFGNMESGSFIAANRKDLSYALFKRWKVPVPATKEVKTFKECLSFLKKYRNVVVKPVGLKWGLGVTAGITNQKLLKEAIQNVKKYLGGSKHFLIQEFLDGNDYRVLVVGYKKVFCLQRNPAYTIGDGKSMITTLIKKGRVFTGSLKKFREIPSKSIDLALNIQGLNRKSVPKKGQKVKLSTTSNVHFGGFTVNKTGMICREAKSIAITIARKFASPVLGIDFISPDITKTPGKVTEVNPNPDILMHTQPSFGKAHNPADALIDFLFFSGKESEINRKPNLD